ncbi:hypothetical protein SEPCBS57363_003864 [Sporothrix epigloea]|uniref:Uncharacterized protein n=1 Tax=Sporothrix epigloea TaxID=1892477 RepID=A0ABP0DNX2_9PEZI
MPVSRPMILRRGLLFRHGVDIRNGDPTLTGLAGDFGNADSISTVSDDGINANSERDLSDYLPSSMPIGDDDGLGKGGESRSYVQRTPGLGKSAIAGIAVRSIVAALVVVGLIMWLCTRKPKPRHEASLAGQDHHHQQGEGSVVFAKLAGTSPAQSEGHGARHDVGIDLCDKPPAYDEIVQQSDLHQGSQIPLQGLSSVSNGFRQYCVQPFVLKTTPRDGFDGEEAQR